MKVYRSIRALRIVWAFLLALFLVVPVLAAPAAAATQAPQRELNAARSGVIMVVATVAEAAASTDATAQPGDGVIRIVTRVCANDHGWQQVAADNGITASSNPPYLVLVGQVLAVMCEQANPAPVVQAAAPPVVQQPAPAAQPAGAGGQGWTDPLPNNAPLCNYGRWRGSYAHQGEDIPAGSGTPILAAGSGNVSTHWQAGGAGNYTVINHGGGTHTVYMHQSSFEVRSGYVTAGQVIGYVGSTGDSQGPHLHFEVHPNGLWNGTANPTAFLAARGVALGC